MRAQGVVDREVELLDAHGLARRHADRHVDELAQLSAARSGQADRRQADRLCRRDRAGHVARVAGGADADEQVARSAVGDHLLGKGVLGAHVVGKGGEQRRVRREADGRQPALQCLRQRDPAFGQSAPDLVLKRRGQRPFLEEALDQLAGDVVAIGAASPVAAQQQLSAGPEDRDELARGLLDRRAAGQEGGVGGHQRFDVNQCFRHGPAPWAGTRRRPPFLYHRQADAARARLSATGSRARCADRTPSHSKDP